MQRATFGRYVLFDVLAKGGMATVYLGRLLGSKGFARTVAIKRLHPHLASEIDEAARFVDEARLAARVHHPNVVSIVDVVSENGEAYLVMDYVHGDSLANLQRRAIEASAPIPLAVVGAIMCGVLEGLHAAHEAKSEDGKALHIVHRDVSPQNILVGADGVARVLDFGVAKATGRAHSTTDGRVKGKLAYMAPEQLEGGTVDRRTDVFAAGIVLWELLTGEALFGADTDGQTVNNVLGREVIAPSRFRDGLPGTVDLVVMRALQRTAAKRYPSARQMARELEVSLGVASPTQVAGWVDSLAGDVLSKRGHVVERIEAKSIEQAGVLRADIRSARLIVAAQPIGGELPVLTVPVPPSSSEEDLAYAETAVKPSPKAALDTGDTASAAPPLATTPVVEPRPSRWPLALLAFALGVSIAAAVAYRRAPSPSMTTAAPPVNAPAATPAPSTIETAAPGPTESALASAPAPPPTQTAATPPATTSTPSRKRHTHPSGASGGPASPGPPGSSSIPSPAPTYNPNAEY